MASLLIPRGCPLLSKRTHLTQSFAPSISVHFLRVLNLSISPGLGFQSFHQHKNSLGGSHLARSNYRFKKRQKEIKRKKKQEEKRKRKMGQDTINPEEDSDLSQNEVENPSEQRIARRKEQKIRKRGPSFSNLPSFCSLKPFKRNTQLQRSDGHCRQHLQTCRRIGTRPRPPKWKRHR